MKTRSQEKFVKDYETRIRKYRDEYYHQIAKIGLTNNKLNSNDICAIVDVRCRIWQQLKIGFRFEYSINSMRTRHFRETTYYHEQTRQQRNNTLSLYLVYMINEKKTDKIKSLKATDRTYYY